MGEEIKKNIDYELRCAYTDLIGWVEELGDKLRKNYECMEEIQDVKNKAKDLMFDFFMKYFTGKVGKEEDPKN